MKTLVALFILCGQLAMAQAIAPANNQVETQVVEVPSDILNFTPAQAIVGRPYFDWGHAQNGFGYCYEWIAPGQALNQGQPVSNYNCEVVRPSFHQWGRAQNGFGYCYQYTPYGVAMNMGQPQANHFCELRSPSYYAWSRAQNGNIYCYQYTGTGIAMNQGQPVSEYFCRR